MASTSAQPRSSKSWVNSFQYRTFSASKKKNIRGSEIINKISSTVFSCGRNTCGQLGEKVNLKNKFTPINSRLCDHTVQIVAGEEHTACLSTNGEVSTFGCNQHGALGRPTQRISNFVPGKVKLNGNVKQISAGDAHTAALTADGRVFMWGSFRDNEGVMQEGNDALDQHLVPRRIEIPGRVIKMASGGEHILFLTASGKVFSIGCPDQGQLGRLASRTATRDTRFGFKRFLEPAAVIIKGCKFFTDVWTSQYGSFVRDREMGVFGFGLNDYGQLGLQGIEGCLIFEPLRSPSLSDEQYNWVKIVGGTHHTLLLDKSGKVYSLGLGENGRLGLGENCGNATEPILITALSHKKIVDIGCGSSTSYAVTNDGEAFSWGFGAYGQLGTGEYLDVWLPKIIKRKNPKLNRLKILQADGGDAHAVFLATQ